MTITAEGRKLAQHWSAYGREALDSYLTQQVEHPSINAQSVFMRAFAIDRLFPGQFVDLIEEELLFSAWACHALQAFEAGAGGTLFTAVRSADPRLPEFLRNRPHEPECQHFNLDQLFAELGRCTIGGFDGFRCPFEDAWRRRLLAGSSDTFSILEIGCGSANDFRVWDAYGVASHLDYKGIDVCEANILNAKSRFPDMEFVVGDACCLDESDRNFDVVLAFDLLEHLSPQGLDAALSEMQRVSHDEIWLSLFNATAIDSHQFQVRGDYYWNTLSLRQLASHLGAAGYATEIVSVSRELERRFPGYRHYNRRAHIVIGRRRSVPACKTKG